MGAKHQKLLLGNNVPGKCLQAYMQHFFSPSPAIEKKFAESAFFHTKIKNLSWNRWIYEPVGAKHQELLLGNNAPGKCFPSQMHHFFSPSPAKEEKFAESAFFHTKIKNLSWNRWIYEPNGAKHAPGKCLQAHMQHFFSASPAKEEKFAESELFHTKIKHLSLNRWIYEPIEAKHQKLLLDNNAPGKCLQAHMQHFFSARPTIEKKFAVSAFYSYKNQKLVMKPLNLRANGGKTPRTTPWQQCPLVSAFRPTCNISSALAVLLRKNSLSQHFFIQKSNPCQSTVEFGSQTEQNTIDYSWATMPLASAFRPACNISSALYPPSRKKLLSQHFFIQKSNTCH